MTVTANSHAVAISARAGAEMMRAAVIASPGRAELCECALREPGKGEILVRIEGCGVCGSNLPVWEGKPWFSYPLAPGAPGHEGWGVIEAIGDGVKNCRSGERVAFLSEHAFAEYDITTAAKAVAIPTEFGDTPVPGEPLACAVNIASRSKFQSGESVAIVGVGFLGALLVQLAKMTGANMTAISRRKFARQVAERFGADEVFEWDGSDTAKKISDARGGKGFDCVVECAGTQNSLDLATQLTKERGRLIIAGYHQDGPRQVDMQLWNWRGLDVVNAHERDSEVYVEGMKRALDLITAGMLDTDPLYTHKFPLAELGRAMEMLSLRPDGFMKALVMA